MEGLSNKEIEILLVLFKDISIEYNSNNITKKMRITPAGAFKAMKNLERRNLIVGKKMGKAVFYKVNLKDYYAFRTMETLLINESRIKASRWLNEFKDLFKYTEIIIIFGSILKDPKKANDIDLLTVFKKENDENINNVIKERRLISTKPIHIIKQTTADLENNIKKKDKVILNVIKNGDILYGHEKLLEVIKNVTSI
jgi:Fe-S cluster biosynthesis and repair protein YggX